MRRINLKKPIWKIDIYKHSSRCFKSYKMIDMIEVPTRNIGDFDNVNKNGLKGYVAERALARIIKHGKENVEVYLLENYKIPRLVSLKLKESDTERTKRLKYNNNDPYETYTSSELLISKIVSLNAGACIEAMEIYDYEGLYHMIDFIQTNFPILRL